MKAARTGHSPIPPFGHPGVVSTREAAGHFTMSAPRGQRLVSGRDLPRRADKDKPESAGDIRAAQLQLGHKSLKMTEHYVLERTGDTIGPKK